MNGPHGMGDLYAAQTVGVDFHSSQGEGAEDMGAGQFLLPVATMKGGWGFL